MIVSAGFWACEISYDRTFEGLAMLRRVEGLRTDPLVRFLDQAPVDDEPVTTEEEAALAEVEADRAAGVPTIPLDDVKRKYE